MDSEAMVDAIYAIGKDTTEKAEAAMVAIEATVKDAAIRESLLWLAQIGQILRKTQFVGH